MCAPALCQHSLQQYLTCLVKKILNLAPVIPTHLVQLVEIHLHMRYLMDITHWTDV